MLGQQAFNDGKADIALMHFLRILVKKSEEDNTSKSRDFLDDIELAWARLGNDADKITKSLAFGLPAKVFDIKGTAIHAEVFNPAAIRSDSDAWLSLEQKFLEIGFPYIPAGSTVPTKRPLSLLDNVTSNVVLIGGGYLPIAVYRSRLRSVQTLSPLSSWPGMSWACLLQSVI